MTRRWPGWWSKMEIFCPEIERETIFYVDLDVILTADPSPMVGFDSAVPVLLRDAYRHDGLQSAVMLLPARARREAWSAWMAGPHEAMQRFRRGGDQAFLESLWLRTARRWQDVFEDRLLSYKADYLARKRSLSAAWILFFHGSPRPWQVQDGPIPALLRGEVSVARPATRGPRPPPRGPPASEPPRETAAPQEEPAAQAQETCAPRVEAVAPPEGTTASLEEEAAPSAPSGAGPAESNTPPPGATAPAPPATVPRSRAGGLGTSLADYRGLHAGMAFVVCGCGSSLALMRRPERFVTIGVNDVGRLFTPNYLVVLNPRNQFRGDRFHHVETSKAEVVFSHLNLGISHPRQVRFRLGQRGGVEPSDPNVLHYTRNSPYVAMVLAAHMGARRIGLLGVDFTPNHFFASTGEHGLSRDVVRIDDEYGRLAASCVARGIEVCNLSPDSRLTSLPKMSLDDFANGAAIPPLPYRPRDAPPPAPRPGASRPPPRQPTGTNPPPRLVKPAPPARRRALAPPRPGVKQARGRTMALSERRLLRRDDEG
jgi:hypothetical protein